MKCTIRNLIAAAVTTGSMVAMTPVAHAQVPINIVYPLAGSTVTNYFNSSFGTTCPGGPNTVSWFFDGVLAGQASFYDQFSAQFQNKLPSGNHIFKVVSSCGTDAVNFIVL